MPRRADAEREDERDKDASGWWNRCRHCGVGRYWVRASDTSRSKVRRFVSPDSDELFICACGSEGARPAEPVEAQEE